MAHMLGASLPGSRVVVVPYSDDWNITRPGRNADVVLGNGSIYVEPQQPMVFFNMFRRMMSIDR